MELSVWFCDNSNMILKRQNQSILGLPKNHSLRAAGEQKAKNITLGWNLSDGKAYHPEENCPPAQVMVAFGLDSLHCCRLEGKFDYERAITENSGLLVRSFKRIFDTERQREWCDVIFRFGERAFIYGDGSNIPRIVSYATTEEEAERLAREFWEKYAVPMNQNEGGFHIINADRYSSKIQSHEVLLTPQSLLSDEQFSLHYPQGTSIWHSEFVEKLLCKAKGLSIFEGPPGTGKTSYLRHLIWILNKSHRFYFIPTTAMGVLCNSDFVDFWVKELQANKTKRFVVILEDSEKVLMTRESDNREEVSVLLNISDGMLGDFLRLQVICTINCNATQLDHALLRPGRLICHRKFERLNREQAARLAVHLGKSLPQKEDYSLAEVFSGEEQASIFRPRMGFGG